MSVQWKAVYFLTLSERSRDDEKMVNVQQGPSQGFSGPLRDEASLHGKVMVLQWSIQRDFQLLCSFHVSFIFPFIFEDKTSVV